MTSSELELMRREVEELQRREREKQELIELKALKEKLQKQSEIDKPTLVEQKWLKQIISQARKGYVLASDIKKYDRLQADYWKFFKLEKHPLGLRGSSLNLATGWKDADEGEKPVDQEEV